MIKVENGKAIFEGDDDELVVEIAALMKCLATNDHLEELTDRAMFLTFGVKPEEVEEVIDELGDDDITSMSLDEILEGFENLSKKCNKLS